MSTTIAVIRPGASPVIKVGENTAAAAAAAQRAEVAAQSAVNAPGTSATSTTSAAVGTGSRTFAIQTGKAFVVGQFVIVARTSAPATFMFGQITAHNSGAGSLTVNVTATGGSGTFADWTIALSGLRGEQGVQGLQGATGPAGATGPQGPPGINGTGTGTVTSVNASGGSTGLSFSGGPVTGSGTLALGGTLAVASGGTGATSAAGARSNLGATTLGANLFTLANTSAIRFLRINADNTVTPRTATELLSDIAAAPLASPTFTGNPTAPTPTAGGNDTSMATTAFVQTELMPTVQSLASASSVTPNGNPAGDDAVVITALAANLTINAPTGSPVQMKPLMFRIRDNGTGRTLTWNAIYRAVGVALPTTTVANRTLYVGFLYNATELTWDCVLVRQQA